MSELTMVGNLAVKLNMYGQALEAAVRVEIVDMNLDLMAHAWMNGISEEAFKLQPGKYGIRALLPSGRRIEKVVEVLEGNPVKVDLPVHRVSPHESHEWAYVMRDIGEPGGTLLSDEKFTGTWVRLWIRKPAEENWEVTELQATREAINEDGVGFDLQLEDKCQYMLQVGGENIPWKFVALPPGRNVMILIRPSSAPEGGAHPLHIAVCTDDWRLESLLSLLSRGNSDEAANLLEKEDLASVAEDKLYSKVRDTYGAVVGGHALLHLNAFDRMHSWVENLANWFPWVSDGAVIHGWQLLDQASATDDEAIREKRIKQARDCFLEAEKRGLPLVTEGLFRLRDGLLLFHRDAKEGDKEIRAALSRVGEYTACSDRSSSNTLFSGSAPTIPTMEQNKGLPVDGLSVSFLYDIPIKMALDAGIIPEGSTIKLTQEGSNFEPLTEIDPEWAGTITKDGLIESPGGQMFESVAAMQKSLSGTPKMAPYNWQVGNEQLESVISQMRLKSIDLQGGLNQMGSTGE